MKLNKTFFDKASALIFLSAGNGIFEEEPDEKWGNDVAAMLSCLYLLAKATVITDNDFVMSEEELKILKSINENYEQFRKEVEEEEKSNG